MDRSELLITSHMDEAYAMWTPEHLSYPAFVDGLTNGYQFAVLIGNLDEQVRSDGFCAWDRRGFSSCSGLLLDHLAGMVLENLPVTRRIQPVVAEVMTELRRYARHSDDAHFEALMASYTKRYRRLADDFMAEAETYFRRTYDEQHTHSLSS